MKVRSLILLSVTISILISFASSQICAQSQYFNGQRCAPCKSNCKCTSDNTCNQCLPGYTFDARFQNCLQCPYNIDSINIGCKECCSQISGTEYVCSQCKDEPYVFMKGGQCIKIQGCLNLLDNGMCSSCAPGYFLEQGKCNPCHSSCQTCRDSTLCLTCHERFFNQTNINYALCGACNTGCKTCTSNSTCTSCLEGYYFSTPNCLACGSNCLVCTAGGCSQCDSSSTLISGICYMCINPVKSGSAGCSQCSTATNLIKCNKCDDGYYLSNGQCQLCSATFSNSVRCTSSGPIQCKDDYHNTLSSRYHLVNNQCVANTKLCKTMSATNGDCSQCYFEAPDKYYRLSNKACTKCVQTGCKLFNSNCQCLQCEQSYRYVNNLCVACQNLHCIKCQSDVQSCEKCAPYYGRFSSACISCAKLNCINCDGDYTSCVTCQDGFYLSSGSCYQCQANCLLCESNTKCTLCSSGYYLQNNGRCKQLPTNCVEIDSDYLAENVAVCKKCQYGYQVILGSCYPCSHSLFNLNKCEKYCPTYYALLKFGNPLFLWSIFSILGLILISF